MVSADEPGSADKFDRAVIEAISRADKERAAGEYAPEARKQAGKNTH